MKAFSETPSGRLRSAADHISTESLMYRNIMVPVDGSLFSREALLQGVRIAERCGANLRLVRVRTSPALPPSPERLSSGIAASKTRATELADLYQLANECRGSSTVSVTVALLDGPVSDALAGYIARHRVDLVVMRSHARQGFARVWFGSTADNLIRRTGIPVLNIRPPSISTGLESGFLFKKILVPLDGSPLAETSLRAALALARLDGATVTLLRVVPPDQSPDWQLQSPLGPATNASVIDAQNYLSSMVAALQVPGLSLSSRVVIADDVAEAILQTAQNHEIDLIAIATHGRGAIARAAAGSVADRLMRESAISTMVVHPQSRVADAELVPVWGQDASFAI